MEALTRSLRAKTASPSYVYQEYERQTLTRENKKRAISDGDVYPIALPGKELFFLELVRDRWNETSLLEWKSDAYAWNLFSECWEALYDSALRNRAFKGLNFAIHFMKTLDMAIEALNKKSTVDNGLTIAITRTIELLNKSMTIDLGFDQGTKILGKTLELCALAEFEFLLEYRFVKSILTMTDLGNFGVTNNKLSATFCNNALNQLCIYISHSSDMNMTSDINESLEQLLKSIVFNTDVNILSNLQRVIEKSDCSIKSMMVLYRESIRCLSDQNFKHLESLFILITKKYPTIASKLLTDISKSKKTLSYSFLQDLFDNTMQLDTQNEDYWTLLKHILKLDIDVGIKNKDKLLKLVLKSANEDLSHSMEIWKAIIKCHILAREFSQFVLCLLDISQQNKRTITILFETSCYSDVLSESIKTITVSQLNNLISHLIQDASSTTVDISSLALLRIVLDGLKYFPTTGLELIKSKISTLLNLHYQDSDLQRELLRAKYHAITLFDDFITVDFLEEVTQEIEGDKSFSLETPKEFYYFVLKVREHKPFNIENMIAQLVELMAMHNDNEFVEQVVYCLFERWATLINTLSLELIQELWSLLITRCDNSVVLKLFQNDDLFEETRVITSLINTIKSQCEEDRIAQILIQIPIQCINKRTRVEILDQLINVKEKSEKIIDLITYLLTSPTFRSKIETEPMVIYQICSSRPDKQILEDRLFEKLWMNHTKQLREQVSSVYVSRTFAMLNDILENSIIDQTSLLLFHLAVKYSEPQAILKQKVLLIKHLIRGIERILNAESANKDHADQLPWLVNCLYHTVSIEGTDDDTLDSCKRILKVLSYQINHNKLAECNILHSGVFLLSCFVHKHELSLLSAHYIILRDMGLSRLDLACGISLAMKHSANDQRNLNGYLLSLIYDILTRESKYTLGLMELYNIAILNISKNNDVGIRIFRNSISILNTALHTNSLRPEQLQTTIKIFDELLIVSPWLFNQYDIEQMFPFCLRLCRRLKVSNSDVDEIMETCIYMISKIFLVHRVKLSERNHFVCNFISSFMDLFTASSGLQIANTTAAAFSRLITNYCEPSSSQVARGAHKAHETISSRSSIVKQSIRKSIPMVLLKFIHLSINNTFESSIRQELTPAIYSIFDLLSRNELKFTNAALDTAGKQYFQIVYAEYKTIGKWHED